MVYKTNNKAICYVAFGDLYISQALLSIKSLRKIDSQTKVVLVTNSNFDPNVFNFWDKSRDQVLVFDAALNKNRNYKTNILKYVDAEKIAYIDSDTLILSKFDIAWDFLDYFDVALKLNPVKQKRPGKGDISILNNRFKVSELPHFNGGMFFFKKSEASKEFFNIWHKKYKEHNSPYDQISLNEALFKSNVQILPLTSEWNYFPDLNFYRGKRRNPIIFHYTNRISYVLENELLNIADLACLSKNLIKQNINKRRNERRIKIGRLEWFKLKFLWFVMYNHEKRRLKLY